MPAYKAKLKNKRKDLKEKGAKKEDEKVDLGVAPAIFKNRTKVLVFASRGITFRERHLMDDIRSLLPHSKKDVKLDKKDRLSVINEIAEIKNCNSVLYFEERKHKDLYLWAARTPNGPSVKFHATNIHTMDELKMTGNCLKGSRTVLSFDASFTDAPHLQLIKELFSQIFAVPKYHNKSKPFVDHIMTFSVLDHRIWVRNFQIIEQKVDKNKSTLMLAEIGPRFVLNPIKVFSGSFSGQILYENPNYVTPNALRRFKRNTESTKYNTRKKSKTLTKERKADAVVPPNEVDEVFRTVGREN